MKIQLGCIADDFTGATDLANNLVRSGMRVVQTIGVPTSPLAADVDAVVVALKSRTIPAAEAIAQSLEALKWLQAQGAEQIYFKYCSTFDSTPEGNIGPVTEALMDALGVQKASVVGSSVGGSIVIALGARHAARMERVFIVEYPIRTEAGWQEGWFRTEKMWTTAEQTMEVVSARVAPGKATPAFLERWNIDRAKAGPKNCLNAMWAMRLHDVMADFATMTTPAMVVYGSRGPAIQTRATMEKALPGAPIIVCEGCGHFPMIDDPVAFIAAIDKGFATLG